MHQRGPGSRLAWLLIIARYGLSFAADRRTVRDAAASVAIFILQKLRTKVFRAASNLKLVYYTVYYIPGTR